MDPSKFTKEQVGVAVRIGDAATKMGLNPDYAIMVLFGDTNFNAAEFGDSDEEIGQNIEANVASLRDAAAKFRDPEKAAIAFYEGSNSPFFSSDNPDDLQSTTQTSLQNIFKQGPFPTSIFSGTEPEETQPSAPSAPFTEAAPEPTITDEQIASERRGAQVVGGGVGAALGAVRGARDIVRGGMPPPKTRNIIGERPGANQPAAGAPRPGPVAQPQPVPGMRPEFSMGTDPQAERILQGTTGDEGTTGRARQTGYNVETAQQAARNKQAQTVVGALQRQGVLDPQKNFFASQAGLTSTPSGVLYPRTEPPRTLGPRGPQGQIGPTQAPPPPPPPKTSGLEYVTRKFEQIANNPVTKFVGKAAERYVLPGLAGTQMLGEGVTAKGEFEQGDYPGAIASGISALGAGLSLIPHPVTRYGGLGLSMVGPAYRSIREGSGKKPEQMPGLMAP
jgi:hypothetical protein